MPYADRFLDTYRLLIRLAKHHLWFTRGAHVAVALVCGLAAFSLRFDFTIPDSYRVHPWVALAVWVAVKPVVFSMRESHTVEVDTLSAPHAKIKVFSGGETEPGEMIWRLEQLRLTCDDRSESRFIRELQFNFPEYAPSAELLRNHEIRQSPLASTALGAGD